MRITCLKVFVDLAESGSFSAAAERNGISQPAVSQQIGGLEEEFSASLVERSRRRFRLTPAGEALFQTARKVLGEIDALKGRITSLEQIIGGELQVATTAHLGVEWLPRLVDSLHSAYPQIRLNPVFRPSARIYADVAGNVADFALVACPREDERFETVILAEEPFCFVVPASSVPNRKPANLTNRQFIAFSPGSPTVHLVQQALLALGYHDAPALHFEHPETVIKAVIATNGFSCLPVETVKRELAAGTLVELHPGHSPVRRTIAAVFLKQRANHPALKAVREFLGSIADIPAASIKPGKLSRHIPKLEAELNAA